MSVVTMDNNLLEVDKEYSSKKKRKSINTENSEEIKSVSLTKKTKLNTEKSTY